MRKSREEQNEEIKEYQKIENKYKRRIARKNLSDKKRLENNKKAKEEMKKLKEEGRLKPFEERGKYKYIEMYEYRDYYVSSNDNAKYLHAIRPDIVKTLNETIRKEEEEKRARLERSKSGEACPGLKAHVAWMKKQKKQQDTDKNENEDDECVLEDKSSNDSKIDYKRNTLKISYQ